MTATLRGCSARRATNRKRRARRWIWPSSSKGRWQSIASAFPRRPATTSARSPTTPGAPMSWRARRGAIPSWACLPAWAWRVRTASCWRNRNGCRRWAGSMPRRTWKPSSSTCASGCSADSRAILARMPTTAGSSGIRSAWAARAPSLSSAMPTKPSTACWAWRWDVCMWSAIFPLKPRRMWKL